MSDYIDQLSSWIMMDSAVSIQYAGRHYLVLLYDLQELVEMNLHWLL